MKGRVRKLSIRSANGVGYDGPFRSSKEKFQGLALKKTLETSEWVLSASLIILIASLYLTARYNTCRKLNLLPTLPPPTEIVEITIQGEVANAGTYRIEKGGRIGDTVKKSRPKPFADLGSIDLDSPAKESMCLEIRKLSEIVVRVEGAVEGPVQLTLPAGSRIADLRSKVSLAPNADLKFFKRKKQLKHLEVVKVPAVEPLAENSGKSL